MSIRIVVILGSVRRGSYISKAAEIVVDELRKQDDVEVDVLDPGDLDLPLPGREDTSGAGKIIRERAGAATGVILATPEYHGSYSSVIKLVIDNLGYPSSLRGKPIALLGAAAGAIGAIKALEHLRSVCAHVGGIVLPSAVSIASVQKVIHENGSCSDPAVEKRIRGVGLNLLDYIRQNICPRLAMEQMARE